MRLAVLLSIGTALAAVFGGAVFVLVQPPTSPRPLRRSSRIPTTSIPTPSGSPDVSPKTSRPTRPGRRLTTSPGAW